MSCGLLVRRTTNRQSTRSIVRADGRRPSGDGIAPLLIEQGSGHILNAASAGGLMPLPTITPYNATMPAAVGLTETLNVELRAVPPSPSPRVGASVSCPGRLATGLGTNSRALESSAGAAATGNPQASPDRTSTRANWQK